MTDEPELTGPEFYRAAVRAVVNALKVPRDQAVKIVGAHGQAAVAAATNPETGAVVFGPFVETIVTLERASREAVAVLRAARQR